MYCACVNMRPLLFADFPDFPSFLLGFSGITIARVGGVVAEPTSFTPLMLYVLYCIL